jgi:hypothetical protein
MGGGIYRATENDDDLPLALLNKEGLFAIQFLPNRANINMRLQRKQQNVNGS